VASLASAVIANSHSTANAVRGWLPEGLLHIVPNGIDLEKFEAVRPVAQRDRLVVAMVANMTSAVKRHELFIEAAGRVASAVPVEFRLYGHLPSSPRVAAECRRRLEEIRLTERFHLVGFLADPAQIMSEIDVLVHVAEGESFGRVVVEAMAAGRPVVGVRGGGVAEIVSDGETGLLADVNDPEGLAKHINTLLGDADLRERMGTRAKQRARSEYSIQRCAAGVRQAYCEAMNRPLGKSSASRMT
jgi:glycosyltransferase involved in cell wall biosynthesis